MGISDEEPRKRRTLQDCRTLLEFLQVQQVNQALNIARGSKDLRHLRRVSEDTKREISQLEDEIRLHEEDPL